MSITTRTLSVEDYDAITQVWREAGLSVRTTGRDSRENFMRQMASGIQTVLGAFEGEMLVGVTVITHDTRKGWINRLAVLPSYQRRGIGRTLIRAGEAAIHNMGLEIVAALVEHDNPASLALFKAEGYIVEPTHYVTKRGRPDA